ncbi:malonyl-ACP O-methyltransferase BioC [Arhodomonas sp. SL1]|uniref:malonyl-ACP O-methyltransferase BioC n=1 Tax=Arhodomonas sp. SL1 TaxID=3425691 RepID=UPI003F8818FA
MAEGQDVRVRPAAFERAAATYDEAAALQQEVGRRLVERFELLRVEPTAVLDIGAGTGTTTRLLMERYRRARFTALDPALAMLRSARRRAPRWRRLRTVAGRAEALPLATESFDIVFSNLALHWVTDLAAAFADIRRVLRPGGVLMFTAFGPDTLAELRDAWAAVDGSTRVNTFVDMHDIGDAMARARLAEPVMDMERLTLTYAGPEALLHELRDTGSHAIASARPRGLTTPRRLQAMYAAYPRGAADGSDRIAATYEIIYGHAWGTGEIFRPGERAQAATASP